VQESRQAEGVIPIYTSNYDDGVHTVAFSHHELHYAI
jgi:hypothetical protein